MTEEENVVPVPEPEETPVETELYIPPFPLGVALIGAPDSGKQAVINEFHALASPWLQEQDQRLAVIDNPGNRFEQDFDQAVGVYGGYVEDLWVMFERMSSERAARANGISYISSSTIIENMAHCGTQLETIMLGLQTSGLVTPQTEQQVQKQQLALSTLTMLFLDTFRYSLAFYLPLTEKIILPGQDEQDDRYSKRVDAAIKTIMQNFDLRIQVLDQPTAEEKAQAMFSTMTGIMTEGVQIPKGMMDDEALVENNPADSATLSG